MQVKLKFDHSGNKKTILITMEIYWVHHCSRWQNKIAYADFFVVEILISVSNQ